MFCRNCGQQINPGVSFCGSCGEPVSRVPEANAGQAKQSVTPAAQRPITPQQQNPQTPPRQNQQPYQNQQFRQNAAPVYAAPPQPPQSQSNSILLIIVIVILFLLLVIGCVVYSIVTDKMPMEQALKAGLFISSVFLICTLISKFSSARQKPYDEVVIDKKSRIRTHNGNDNDSYTEYTITVQTDDGKRKKIVETDRSRAFAWNYLNIGNRFRFHPKFAFPYERYEKSTARCLYCVVCERENPVEADRCQKCGVPLLK